MVVLAVRKLALRRFAYNVLGGFSCLRSRFRSA